MKTSLLINYEWWDTVQPKRQLEHEVIDVLNAHTDSAITDALERGIREGQLLCDFDGVQYQGYFTLVRTEAVQ